MTNRVIVFQKTDRTIIDRGQTGGTGSEGNVNLIDASSAVWLDVGT